MSKFYCPMPKELKINLLGGDDFSHTPWGRLITWATTYGRYIMITTEIVVLLAFISRFSLDRKLTDLTEEMTQKQDIIEANAPFEQDIKALQAKMTRIKTLLGTQEVPLEVVNLLVRYVPRDVYLESLEFAGGNLAVSAVAATSDGLSQFLARLQSSPTIQDIAIGDIRRNIASGIQFTFTASVPAAKK